MPIPSPGIPSAITPISSVELHTTLNNRAFYVNSGLISADNTETTVISIDDIGKRDILLCVNPILTSDTADNMTMRVKNNDSVIYQRIYLGNDPYSGYIPDTGIHFIIPANTNIEITFQNADATSHNVGISAYGYYLD